MAVLEREIEGRVRLFASADAPEGRTTPTQYDDLLREGVTEGVHVELVDGLLIYKMPQNRTHSRTIGRLLRAFNRVVTEPLEILSGGTVTFGDRRLEPDVSVSNPRDDEGSLLFDQSEMLLVVEVSVSTLAYDRGKKTRYYAEGRVPEYWIVNPVARQIEVYRDPVDGVYAFVALVLPGELLDALCIPGVEFAADDLLPPADAVYD